MNSSNIDRKEYMFELASYLVLKINKILVFYRQSMVLCLLCTLLKMLCNSCLPRRLIPEGEDVLLQKKNFDSLIELNLQKNKVVKTLCQVHLLIMIILCSRSIN